MRTFHSTRLDRGIHSGINTSNRYPAVFAQFINIAQRFTRRNVQTQARRRRRQHSHDIIDIKCETCGSLAVIIAHIGPVERGNISPATSYLAALTPLKKRESDAGMIFKSAIFDGVHRNIQIGHTATETFNNDPKPVEFFGSSVGQGQP